MKSRIIIGFSFVVLANLLGGCASSEMRVVLLRQQQIELERIKEQGKTNRAWSEVALAAIKRVPVENSTLIPAAPEQDIDDLLNDAKAALEERP